MRAPPLSRRLVITVAAVTAVIALFAGCGCNGDDPTPTPRPSDVTPDDPTPPTDTVFKIKDLVEVNGSALSAPDQGIAPGTEVSTSAAGHAVVDFNPALGGKSGTCDLNNLQTAVTIITTRSPNPEHDAFEQIDGQTSCTLFGGEAGAIHTDSAIVTFPDDPAVRIVVEPGVRESIAVFNGSAVVVVREFVREFDGGPRSRILTDRREIVIDLEAREVRVGDAEFEEVEIEAFQRQAGSLGLPWPPPTPTPTTTTALPPTLTPTPTRAPTPPPTQLGTLVSIGDGTLGVVVRRVREQITLVGLDVPGGSECFAREVTSFLAPFAQRETEVRLEVDPLFPDTDERRLRYVYLPDGNMLNEILLIEGYARPRKASGALHEDVLLKAGLDAQERGAGLWTACEQRAAAGRTYVLGDFVVEDRWFELRMGETTAWGYSAGERVQAIPDGPGIVMGPVQVGDTISFDRCRLSASRSSTSHHFTIEALGIDYNLDDGSFGSDTPGGEVGVRGDPTDNCDVGPFTAPGEYVIDDRLHPGAHGVAVIIVKGVE